MRVGAGRDLVSIGAVVGVQLGRIPPSIRSRPPSRRRSRVHSHRPKGYGWTNGTCGNGVPHGSVATCWPPPAGLRHRTEWGSAQTARPTCWSSSLAMCCTDQVGRRPGGNDALSALHRADGAGRAVANSIGQRDGRWILDPRRERTRRLRERRRPTRPIAMPTSGILCSTG